MEQGSS